MPTDPTGAECAAQLQALGDWVASVTGQSPTDDASHEGRARVLVQPVGVRPANLSGPTSRVISTAEVQLQVLVCAVGGSATERSCLTCELALDVLASGRWVLRGDGPDLAVWRSLGLSARPGLLLEIPVRRVLDRSPAPPVRQRLHVGSMPIRELTGRLVAPDGTPVPAAVLTILPTGPSATTDHRGNFALTAAVASTTLHARIQARGSHEDLQLDPAADGSVGNLVVTGLTDLTSRATPATPQEV